MNLKQEIEPILLDKSLTKEERSKKLAILCQRYFDSVREDLSMDEAFDYWNSTMADIVEERNLGAVH